MNIEKKALLGAPKPFVVSSDQNLSLILNGHTIPGEERLPSNNHVLQSTYFLLDMNRSSRRKTKKFNFPCPLFPLFALFVDSVN